jgi:hypothetical protein
MMQFKMRPKSKLVFFLLALGLIITAAWSPLGITQASPLTETQLLQNPGFSSGSWSPWDNYGSSQLTNSLYHSDPYSLNFGDAVYGKIDDLVGQNVTIPLNTTHISLSFWYQTDTEEVAANADKMCLGLYETDFSSAYAESCVDIGDEGSITEWKQFTYDLPLSDVLRVKDKTVMFGISFVTDWTLPSRGWVDNAALIVDDTPIPYTYTYLPMVMRKH